MFPYFNEYRNISDQSRVISAIIEINYPGAMHRENELLPHLSPEGRGRANEVSEGEGVRKVEIFLVSPSPLTPPSPLWGEGVASVARGEILTSSLPLPRCRGGG
jgi:hypothetical protein